MIYAVFGTQPKIREKAFTELGKLGALDNRLYSDTVYTLRSLVEATSLFGDVTVVVIEQGLESAKNREEVYGLLDQMKESANIFIFDEPFADANRVKKLEKYAKKTYDAREEKEVERSPFILCNAFAKRDKKAAFVEWMILKEVAEPMEMVQMALWWKIKTIWEDTLAGKSTKFTVKECEMFASKILRSGMDAHRGDAVLKDEIEKVVLSV